MRFCDQCGAAFQSARSCPRDRAKTRADIDDPLVGAVLGERYRVLERIAAGGMGQVYRAAHTRIACLFAVKVLYGDLAFDPSTLSRFLREAEVASVLQSRHIVRVVDFGQTATDLPYLVMEYLDGSTLFDIIARGGPVEPMRALRIAQRILRGLAHAHERGIIHRDMKAENVILVSEDDEADVPKLLDFGVARLREADGERLTSAGIVLGTPLYMAPEQFTGLEIDARADLYAVGVILFEMLRGSPPFEAPSVRALAEKHMTETPPDLSDVVAAKGGDPEICAVVRRLLEKSPADRYASARDAAQAMEAIVHRASGASAAAPPPLPPIDPELIALIESTIVAGAPAYNAGDHQGCATLYRRTVEDALKRFPKPLASVTRLRTGLFRAATRATATLAAWELRYAFDDLLLAAPLKNAGTTPLARELALFGAIAARRENAGHMGILGDYAVEFARTLAVEIRNDPGGAESAALLEQAVKNAEKSDPGATRYACIQVGLDAVREATKANAPTSLHMERIVVREAPRPSMVGPMSGPLPPPPEAASAQQPTTAGGELLETLVRASQIASSATNEGRHEVAYRVFREALDGIARVAARDPSGGPFANWIQGALASAAKRQDRDAAKMLRGAVDAILKRES